MGFWGAQGRGDCPKGVPDDGAAERVWGGLWEWLNGVNVARPKCAASPGNAFTGGMLGQPGPP